MFPYIISIFVYRSCAYTIFSFLSDLYYLLYSLVGYVLYYLLYSFLIVVDNLAHVLRS